MAFPRPIGDYGYDAPWVPWMWIGFGVSYAALTVCAATLWSAPGIAVVIVAVLAVLFVLGAVSFWYATLRGKYIVWDRLLATITPPHRVLDLGCGRGAVAIMVAARFPEARVDGIDLWRRVDQSGNSPDAALANARANGVEDRVSFSTSDMTDLPFDNGQFDLVTASLSIHNVSSARRRRTALSEAWRVLAPGGQLLIVDIGRVREYPAVLRALGALGLTVRDAGWRVWWSGPWMGTRVVRASKARSQRPEPET